MQINGDRTFYLIKIKGLVQGVGFRPFIFRLASDFRLKGWVENNSEGVHIKIETDEETLNDFRKNILLKAPVASQIQSVDIQISEKEYFDSFTIRKSTDNSLKVTEVSPDIAVCNECLVDLKSQEHRIHYPFINCTNCGPRFSIIREVPYDRPSTTMESFKMCPQCNSEYTNSTDRRFHAQPVACNYCGPVYTLHLKTHSISNFSDILEEISSGLLTGKIYAVKGVGGFHLMCNAFDETSVQRLRSLKHRDAKPFAVMFRSVEAAREYVLLNSEEEALLTSWRRPILLVQKEKDLVPGITNGLSTLGIMLPYMPFHYLLFEKLSLNAVVLTSGNFSGEPILISNQETIEKLSGNIDGILTYNRNIHNRTDDSVVAAFSGKTQIMRRSRGFAPSPVQISSRTEGILAVGAELENTFCIGKGNQAIMSQYIGDLKNFETYNYFKETYYRFIKLFKFKPEMIVCDLHPDYLSSRFATEYAEENPEIPLIKVQHHHAHVASVMASCNIAEPALGFCFDGMGLGTDRNIWGGELLKVSLSGMERLSHFEYVPLPGGDKANEEPWRMAVSWLYHSYGDKMFSLPLPMFKEVSIEKCVKMVQMIQKGINCPLTSSSGRLFDAVAAISGVCCKASFHAEAPMRLESVIDKSCNLHYDFDFSEGQIIFKDTIQQVVDDILGFKPIGIVAAKFHNTLANVILKIALEVGQLHGLTKVVLSGGTFQNRYLSELSGQLLLKKGFEVLMPSNIPVNDQGIALGQLIIAAQKREQS